VLPRLGVSLLHVADLFQELRPEAVVVTGGYAGGPAGIGAGLAGIPLVLQEGNAVPGVTTRLLSRWARQVHVAFPEASDHLPAAVRSRVIVSGNPVRTPPRLTREEARRAFDLPADALVVLVSGGSQGAAALNRVLLEAVEAVAAGAADRPPGLRLLWSTGPRHHREVTDRLKTLGEPHWVLALPYIDDMLVALAGADLAVSRAGAISTAELLNQGLPAILVPLPTAAADHQRRNAEALAAAGAALLAPEESLTGEALWVQVLGLAGDSARRDAMSTAARDRARPKAAAEIATAVTRLMEGTWSA
jgi:UDP-N-acetylglucosamine--N-acetylmuramyl-(pentapeptide) pyrophosphoryl-undecaprenol N-acetylglucosamine transferase